MKRSLPVLFIGLFLLLCLIPSVGMLLAGPSPLLANETSTTYTVLKHMINRGLFENDNKTVRVLITRDEFYADQSREYVSEQFEGSLPKFIAAFTSKSKLSREEAEELKRMIDNASED